MHDKEFHNL